MHLTHRKLRGQQTALVSQRGWGGSKDVSHCCDWSDFVSGEELFRSDYLGRTKCFCWWRVAVISGSWEIDEMHRALVHWSQPQHWQSMAWLVMRENEVNWASCESVSLPLLCIGNAALLFVSFVLTSLALEWLIISSPKVSVCILYVLQVSLTQRCIFACIFLTIASFTMVKFKRNPAATQKNKNNKMNENNIAYFVAGKREVWELRKEEEKERLKSLKWGPLIIEPGSCLSRQPFLAPC